MFSYVHVHCYGISPLSVLFKVDVFSLILVLLICYFEGLNAFSLLYALHFGVWPTFICLFSVKCKSNACVLNFFLL